MSFGAVRLDGGGCGNVLVKTGGVLICGSDTQGYYVSTDQAKTWTVQNTGVGKSAFYRQSAALLVSQTETSPQVIYSLTGEQGHGGGLLAGTLDANNNITWTVRSAVPQGGANHCAAPLPTDGWKRSTGRLLYQDSLYLYAGTYNQGLMRSSNTGGGSSGGPGTPGLFGNTSTINLYANTSTHALAATAADAATGRAMAYGCQKLFFGTLPSAIQDGNGSVTALASAGCKFYLCITPPHPGTPTDATDLQTALQFWINNWPLGSADALNKLVVVLFQEVQDKLSASEYLAVCNNYVPMIHGLGLKVAFVSAGHARGTNGTGWTSYYPINPGVTPGSAADNLCDIVAVDEYGATWVSQGGSATFDPLQPHWQMADAHGKAWAVTEMGSGVATSPVSITNANFILYMQSIQNIMTARTLAGKPNADCMWYNGDNNAAVINTLSGPNTTVAAGSNGGLIQNINTWGNPSAGVLKVASTAGFGTSSRAGPMWIQCDDGTVARITYNQNVADGTTFGSAGTKCTFISGGNPTSTVSTGNFMAVWAFTNGVTTDFRIPYVQAFYDAVTTVPSGGLPGADDFPVTFQMSGASGNGWFCRAVCGDPNSSTTVYAAFYDTTGNPAGIYKSTNAHATTPNMLPLAGSPTTVEDLFVLGQYLYAACGNGGVQRYGPLNGTPAWQNLNGSTVPNPAGTTTDWWSNVNGWVDGSSNHVILIGNSNASTASQCLMRLVIPSNYPTGSITYSDETPTVTVSTLPGGYTWWHATSNYHNWLGGGAYFCPFTLIDASNLAAVNLWCTGSQGPFRKLAGGGWQIANSGCPMFLGHPVAANPVHAGHLVFGSSDWGAFDDSAAGLETAATLNNNTMVSGQQGFAFAISADGGTVYGSSGQKYTNAAGEVFSRPWDQPSAWAAMGLAAKTANKVAIGLAAFNDNSTPPKQILVAAVRASGMWRWNGTAWTNRNAQVLAADNSGTLMQVHYAGNGLVFAFDRGSGIWRSNDYGLSWALIWAKTSNDNLSGSVAYDVTQTGKGRLWVAASGKLYQLGNADTGTVSGGGITGSGTAVFCPGSGTTGPMGTDGAGMVILASQDQGNGSGLWVTTDDGTTWADISSGDGSFARCAANPEMVAVGPFEPVAGARKIYVSNGNVVAWGYPAAGGAPPGISAPFNEVQQSSNTTGVNGQLLVWFNQTGGAASTRGTMLSARLELTDGSAVITPQDPNWVLDVDAPAQAGSGTARVQIWRYFNNPGGIAGPGIAPNLARVSSGLRPQVATGGRGTGYVSGSTTQAGLPSRTQVPQLIAGAIVPANPVVFNSTVTTTFKGKLFEYATPSGTVQQLDQTGTAGTQAAGTSLLVTAGGANNFTGGLAVVDYAAAWSPSGTGQSWTTPSGWTADGSINNTTLNFATYYQTGIGQGPTSVTATVGAGSGGTMTAWAAGVATYAAVATTPVSITTTVAVDGTLGVAYTMTMAAAGGATPYSWAVTGGALPDGLSMSTSGVITGTPTAAGAFPFQVTVTDSAAQTAISTFVINIAIALSVTTTALPNGAVGEEYRQFLGATGGTDPYSWAVTAGSLPPGLTLTGGNGPTAGTITGVALLAGTFNFTVTVTDSLGAQASAILAITIVPGILQITTFALPPATLGRPYSVQLTATGGGGTYTWSVVSGSLPPGLTLSSSGAITGTLRAAGHYPFTVLVTG
jgi:Putative Ig domain